MERLMCPRCGEVSEKKVPAIGKAHVGYDCAYAECGALLQADFKKRVEDVSVGAISFGDPQKCTCDPRDESALTPKPAPPMTADIALLQKRLRKMMDRS
jgi:hypothetical protein